MPQAPPIAYTLTSAGFRPVQQHGFNYTGWLEPHEVSWDAAAMHPDTAAMLPLVADLLRRVVPGAEVRVMPDLTTCDGFAALDDYAIALSGNQRAWQLLDAALHEAFHLVESRMSPRDLALCRAVVRDGLPLPQGYYDDPLERSARAFTAWALYHLSRSWTPPSIPSGPRTAEQVYAEVLAGRYRPSSGVVRVTSRVPEPGILGGLLAAYAADARAAFNWLATPFRKLLGDYATQNRRTA